MNLQPWYFEQASRYIETLWSGTATLQEVREETIRQRNAEYKLMRERLNCGTATVSKKLNILTHADLHTDDTDFMTTVRVLTHNEMMQTHIEPSRVSALCVDLDKERKESQNIKFGVNRFVTKRPRVLQR